MQAININIAMNSEDPLIPQMSQFYTVEIGNNPEVGSAPLGSWSPYQNVFLDGNTHVNPFANVAEGQGHSPVDATAILMQRPSSRTCDFYNTRVPGLYPIGINNFRTSGNGNGMVPDNLWSASLVNTLAPQVTHIAPNSLILASQPRIAGYDWHEYDDTTLEYSRNDLLNRSGAKHETLRDVGFQFPRVEAYTHQFAQPRIPVRQERRFQ
jgi:hypothetical protein